MKQNITKVLGITLTVATLLAGCSASSTGSVTEVETSTVETTATPETTESAVADTTAPVIELTKESVSADAGTKVSKLDLSDIIKSVEDDTDGTLKLVDKLEDGTAGYVIDYNSVKSDDGKIVKGTYTVKVTAQDEAGNKSTEEIELKVKAKETASTSTKKTTAKAKTTTTKKSNNTTAKTTTNSTSKSSNTTSTTKNTTTSSNSTASTTHTHNWVTKTKSVNHPAETAQKWVQDSAAWDETVVDQAAWDETVMDYGYKCYGCGEIQCSQAEIEAHSQYCHIGTRECLYGLCPTTVHHDATYKTVHHDATGHYETVTTKAAYTTNETYQVCSGCGETK